MKESKQRDLFTNDSLFNSIKEDEIIFPLFFKSKDELKYLRYEQNGKFECTTGNKIGNSLRGCFLWGYDETIKQVRGDVKLWYHSLIRNHIKITSEEYEQFFSNCLEQRQVFFTTNEHEYIEPIIENQPEVKHKWKPINQF